MNPEEALNVGSFHPVQAGRIKQAFLANEIKAEFLPVGVSS